MVIQIFKNAILIREKQMRFPDHINESVVLRSIWLLFAGFPDRLLYYVRMQPRNIVTRSIG